MTVELVPGEIGAIIAHHDEFTAARARHDRETELSHLARTGYLRQRLGAVAPRLLTPDGKGHV